jgi:protein phosphatase/serine/threonine-protein phosphatase Stp1
MSNSGLAEGISLAGSARASGATHPGTAGRINEDAYLSRPDLGLWGVADGAGGHQSGEVASSEVVNVLDSIDAGLTAGEMLHEVRSRLDTVHGRLLAMSAQRGRGVLMATTVVIVIARDDYFACLWVGDSAAYLLRANVLTKITRDHSVVQEMVDRGMISEEQAYRHPKANMITRAIGADCESLVLDKRTGPLAPGDRILLCSDGLTKTLSNQQLVELSSMDGGFDAKRLVAAAIEAKATDNVTAVTIEFIPPGGSVPEAADLVPAEAASIATGILSADENRLTANDDGSDARG